MTARPPAGVILLTAEYEPFPGGIATYSTRLADEVRKAGFAAHVLAPLYPDLPAAADAAATHRILRHHRIPPSALLAAPRVLRGLPPDLPFLAADIRSVLLARVTAPLHRRRYRAMIHGSEVSKLGSRNPLWSLVRRAYADATMIVANSHATLAAFQANFGAHRRVAVSHLGIESSWFDVVGGDFDDAQLRALAPGTPLVCTVGRIEARKGQLEAVRVLARLRDAHGLRDVVYVVAGRPEDADYTRAVREEALRLHVPALFTGAVSGDDLRRLFRRAAAHLLCARQLPGKIEGFGLVILEAAAQGCPTVTTLVGGIPEAIGATGACLPPEDLPGMAAAVATYVADAPRRERAGDEARAHARGFTWRRCAEDTFPELDWRGAGRG